MSINRLLVTVVFIGLLSACAGTPDCDPDRGFEAGRNQQAAVPACDQSAYGEAWRLGSTLGELEREQSDLEARGSSLTTAERARLRILTRDIPELETLARIQGLLPPADISQPDP